jgi:hypothetical protein
MDAFISHASIEALMVARMQQALETDGLKVWVDKKQLLLGSLLRTELQDAIRRCRVLVLLWSQAALKSRWVAAELLTAFHLGRYIVPCTWDDTPLPYFLTKSLYVNVTHDDGPWVERLRRAVRQAPDAANALLPRMSSQSAELRALIRKIVDEQRAVTDALGQRNLLAATVKQQNADVTMAKAEKDWPLELMVLNLGGYHRKNAFMVKHWAALQAGRPPADPLLLESERCFFEALFVDPNDYSGLNGLGSVLILERELDAAEFFVDRAIALAEAKGLDYSAAKHDKALIEWLRQN